MQLQQTLPEFEAAGIRVFAVSYDPVDALAAFSDEFAITYPLLSDEDSTVIRQLGLLNTFLAPDDNHYGIPYPGSYVLDEAGRVSEKLFFQTHRIRPSAESVLKGGFGIEFDASGNPRAEATGEGVRLSATLGWDSLTFMQRVPLYVRLDLDPGLHVYAPPVPEGFVATEASLELPESMRAEAPIYPATHAFRTEGMDEEFQAMDGRVEIEVPVMLAAEEGESVQIGVKVRYQACTDRECYLPGEQTLLLEVPIGRLLRPPRRE